MIDEQRLREEAQRLAMLSPNELEIEMLYVTLLRSTERQNANQRLEELDHQMLNTLTQPVPC